MNAVVKAEGRHEIIAKALEGIREGKTFDQLAEEHKIPRKTLHSWLLSQVPEQYRELQQLGLIARITDADEMLETASSNLHVARAREVARFRRWDAERRLPALFAPKQEISGPGGGPIVLEDRELARRYAFIKAMAARTIDAEFVSIPGTT